MIELHFYTKKKADKMQRFSKTFYDCSVSKSLFIPSASILQKLNGNIHKQNDKYS